LATILTHGLVGAALFGVSQKKNIHWPLVALAALGAILPDVDVIGLKWGVPYGSLWGHRGLTHSLFFAGVWAGLVALLVPVPGGSAARIRLWVLFFLITASHGFLDAFTDGGLGVAFFSPFSNERYFFPWRPIHVSPIGIERFVDGGRSLDILRNEFLWIWIPTLLTVGMVLWLRRPRTGRGS
jgi:inner membrane protein